MTDTENFKKLLALLVENTTHKSLDLSFNHINPKGAEKIADALKSNTTLTSLDLSFNHIDPKGAQAIADALKSNATLTSLKLIGNNIGAKGTQAIADALKTNTTLTSLDLSYNDIDDAQAIADALKTNTTLTSLNLSHNHIDAKGAQAIADALKTNTTLTSLDLGHNHIGSKGAQAIAHALKNNIAIASLDFRYNQIDPQGAEAIADALKSNTMLTSLDLSYNSIGPKGAQVIADALKSNTMLTSLKLIENGIDAEGAQAIADALKTNTTLTSLDLRYNQIDPKGAAIDQLVESNQLKKIKKEAAIKKYFSKVYVLQKQNRFENSTPLPHEALDKISEYIFENISPPVKIALSQLCTALAYLENAHNASKFEKEKLNIDTVLLEQYGGEESIVLWKTMMQLFCRYGKIDMLSNLSAYLESYQQGLTQLLLQENYHSATSVSENSKPVSLYTWAAQCGISKNKIEVIFVIFDKRKQAEETLADFMKRHRPGEVIFFLETKHGPEQSSWLGSAGSFFPNPKESPQRIDLRLSYQEAEEKIKKACSGNQDMEEKHLASLKEQFYAKCHGEEQRESEEEKNISDNLDAFFCEISHAPTRDSSSKLR